MMYTDKLGRQFSGHWVVEPGRRVNRSVVTHRMRLPFDTTVHYIHPHMHAFGESLEFRDLTTGETIFASQATRYTDRHGIARLEHFSSEEGIPVFKDHEYELITVYNNTTAVNQDAMAVMYLYLLNKEFQKPTPDSPQPDS